ncbi:MAG: ABC transporter substrate-binding protein [Deltaproteobacteria bacterium]
MDADCDREPALRGRVCDTDNGVCVDRSALQALAVQPSVLCESTELCTEQNNDEPSLCRSPGLPCVPLQTRDCPRVSGPWRAPNALLFGSIGSLTLRNSFDGDPAPQHFADRLIDAIDLGLDEWQTELPNGLAFSKRPIALVHCDGQGDARQSERVMDHLVSSVKAPLVIALGDLDLAAATEQAVSSDTALLCATCFTRGTESSFDQGLLWRVQPPLEQQAPLAAWRVSDLERAIRRERIPSADARVRVAQLGQQYPGITAFSESARSLLAFNGGKTAAQNVGDFLEIQSPDPTVEAVDHLQIALRIVAFQPDIILVAIDTDFTTYYLPMIENAWPEASPRPFYVATILNEDSALFAPVVGNDDELRRRISGTGLFVDAEVARNASAFAERFQEKYERPPPANVEFGYDAFYAAAYAAVLADRDRRFGGAALVEGFVNLRAGLSVEVSPTALKLGVGYLLSDQDIDLIGTSSRLDWDLTSHQISNDVALWCLSRGAGGSLTLERDAGPRWQSTSGQITGAYGCE